uniref:Alkylated DNA repair protein AlkB homologue 8 N-terminal domain-containing protein n=1 Tax=Knipowitschia caucasica TaxID=637954 RepID=A0AAV2IY56_KNICA
MQPYESQIFQQKVYEEQAKQLLQHQKAVKALQRLKATEDTVEELRPEEMVEELIPEEKSEPLVPEETVAELKPEETVEELRPEEKSKDLRPEETVEELIPEETVEPLIPEETVEALIPEETVEELLIPEDSQLEVLPSEIQEAAVTKQASAEETVDISLEEETQSIAKGTRSAHLMAAAMMKKKVETGVRIPEDSQLTDKDLKAIGKAAAKSLLQECGSVSALSDNSFTEETMKLNLQLSHDSVKLIKFADDTTLIGLISNNDESAYRREVDRLVSWCSGNNLELNAQKTVEMIVDFRKSTVPPPPPSVMDSPITSVESYRFLGTTITQDLKWEPTISSLIKKAQQRMYFLRQLRKAKLPAQMLVQFYTAIIESILTSSITVWFAGATVRDKQRLQRIVRSAEEVIGRSPPSLQDLYVARARGRAGRITAGLGG